MMGEGEAFYEGERMPGARGPGARPASRCPGSQARDGLAAINGSNLINAIGCLAVYDAERWLKQAEIAARHDARGAAGQHEALRRAGCTSCAASAAR